MLLLCLPLMAQAGKPDKNFHIFLCFGQSNMEAGARPAEQDKDFNDPRFQFLAAVDMPRKERVMGHWYTAIPPICREGNNLGPVDFLTFVALLFSIKNKTLVLPLYGRIIK